MKMKTQKIYRSDKVFRPLGPWITVFVFLIIVGGASYSAENSVTIKDSEFDQSAEVIGQSVSIPHGVYLFRSWINKKTGATTHQLYFAVVYSSEGWRFWMAASDDAANRLNVVAIKRDVSSCSRYSGCIHEEHLGVNIPDAFLRSRRDKEYRIKMIAKSGDETIIDIAPAVISAQLAAIDKYKCEKGLAPCTGGAATAKSNERPVTHNSKSSGEAVTYGSSSSQKQAGNIAMINRSGNQISCPNGDPGSNNCVENAKRQGFLKIPDVSIGMALDWNTKPLRVVSLGTRAREAGLREGDTLAELNGVKVSEPLSVYKFLDAKHAGDYIIVKVFRAGKSITAT
jgi:hypothetical protein